MQTESFLAEVLSAIADRGRMLIGRKKSLPAPSELERLCEMLLTERGEASGLAISAQILSLWQGASPSDRLVFLRRLAERFGPDEKRLEDAIAAYVARNDRLAALKLHAAAEPRRQELFRRLNMVQNATRALLEMRVEVSHAESAEPDLAAVETDLVHLLSSWFNRGFLTLRRIDWSTPANILEKVIEYEAVHAIRSWADLKARLAPSDRRCFAFFHPQLADEPLIFVEVALMRRLPASIGEVLAEGAAGTVAPDKATVAVFYSISNCQPGLRGISFGSFLLKQVIEDLQAELPEITDYVTLSPVPGFAAWLDREKGQYPELEAILDSPGWADDDQKKASAAPQLASAAARYLLEARDDRGLPLDPVARFHIGNGARLERINFLADRSPKATRDAHGLMVNYRYRLEDIVKNHELFAAHGQVAAAPHIRRLVPNRRRHVSESQDKPAQSVAAAEGHSR